jgi:hypothetical protein
MGIKRGYIASYKKRYRDNLKIGTGQFIVRIINNYHSINLAYDLSIEAKHFGKESTTFDSLDDAKEFVNNMIQYSKGQRYNFVILRVDAYVEAVNEVLNKDKCKKKRYAVLYEFICESWDKRTTHHMVNHLTLSHLLQRNQDWRTVYLGTVEGYDKKDVEKYVDKYNAHIYIYPLRKGKIVPKEHTIPPIVSIEEFRTSRADWEYDKDSIIRWQNNLKTSGSYELIPFEWLLDKQDEKKKQAKEQKIKEVKEKILGRG